MIKLDCLLLFSFQVFSLENPPVTTAEFEFLKYQCGYWDFPKNNDINIIDTKYLVTEDLFTIYENVLMSSPNLIPINCH